MVQWLVDLIQSSLDFSNVLNSSITASWVVLAVLVLRILLKKAPKWTHVALWGLVAIRLLLPFSLESSFSLIPSAETLPREILRYEGERLREPAHLDIVANPVIPENVTVELEQSVDRVQILTMYMSFIHWGGISVLLLYTAVSYYRLHRKVQTAVKLRENIFRSEKVGAPFVLGIIRPRIYVPYKIAEQDMQHVIAHEQTHIRRKDHWWKPLGFLLLTVHWFNPLMWLAYVLFCRDVELACDESVIRGLNRGQRAEYSQALLSCSVRRSGIAACPLAFGEVGVKERVKNVLKYKKPALGVVLVALIAGIVAAVCLLTNPVTGTDHLTFTGYENYGGGYLVDFTADLGDKVQSGTIHVEQWYQGECVKSVPGVLTKDLEEIDIRMSVSRINGTLSGVNVQIETDEYGGYWQTYFAFPEGESMLGWAFESYAQGDELEIKPGEEKILAALSFDQGEGVRVFGCDTLISEPKRLKEAGYMIVVRAAFHGGLQNSSEEDTGTLPTEVQQAEDGGHSDGDGGQEDSGHLKGGGTPEDGSQLKEGSTPEDNSFAQDSSVGDIIDLEQVIGLEETVRKRAYISVLENILYRKIAPDGREWGYGTDRFAIYDIDFDGSEELIIEHLDNVMAGMKMLVYDYDRAADAVRKEFSEFPAVTFYDNGVIEAQMSHNQGLAAAAEDFWPYSLYQYNEAADTYDLIAIVDGWYKAGKKEDYDGNPFPEEADKDGDGMVYYIMTDGKYVLDTPVDNEAYHEWRETFVGDSAEVEISYIELPEVVPDGVG